MLLLIIGEAAQHVLLGEDISLTRAMLVIATLLSLDVGLSLAKRRWRLAEKLVEGVPTIIVADGALLRDRIHRCRLSEDDILQAARAGGGLLSVKEIRFAVLETDGSISIIPYRQKDRPGGPDHRPVG